MIASIILALYLLGVITAKNAYIFLYATGVMLIIGEFFVGSFGIIAFNGLIALFVASAIQTDEIMLFGLPVDWSLLFGIAFVEAAVIAAFIPSISRRSFIWAP